MNPAPGVVVGGRYRLVRAIGEGAMGEVWLAQHLALEVPCAIKLIRDWACDNEEALRRFEREGRATAQLASAHVVRIFDYGEVDRIPYIAMEYLEGESLSRRLERQMRLSPAETMQVVEQVGRALARAHKAGIVHRDLKPANVFVVRDAVDGEICKVVDFGVAKEQGLNLTMTGMLMGTPAYMSPEQAVGSTAVDHRSDLWALGVLAFRCLLGELPFAQTDKLMVLLAIVEGEMPVPSAMRPDVPRGFDAWWARACARDPEQRFQSALEQAEALREALGLSAAAPLPPAPTAGLAPRALGSTVAMPAPVPAPDMQATFRPAAATPISPPQRGRWWIAALAVVVLLGAAGGLVAEQLGGEEVVPEPATPEDPAAPEQPAAHEVEALPEIPSTPISSTPIPSVPSVTPSAPAPVALSSASDPTPPAAAIPSPLPPRPLPRPVPPPAPKAPPPPKPKDRLGF